MRISPEIFIIFFRLMLLSATGADAAADNKFTPVVPLFEYKKVDAEVGSEATSVPHHVTLTMATARPVTFLDPVKASQVRDGMTLKELVDALGPGYNEYNDGTIVWFFSDNRTLSVKPLKLDGTEVIFFLSEKSKTLDNTMQWVGPEPNKKGFQPFIVLDDFVFAKIKPLDPIKALLVRDGMTLKQLVDALGPGYMRENEGVGIITWIFANDRQLHALPSTYKEVEVLSFNSNDGRSRIWWDPER